MRKPKSPSTAITVPKGTAIANLSDLADKGRDYAERALSKATRHVYGVQWGKFSAWCEANGIAALPAHPGAIAMFITSLAEAKLSNSTISQTLSAIKHFHRKGGYPLSEQMKDAMNSPDDSTRRQWAEMQRVLDGVRRTVGQSRTVRRVKPIGSRELRDIIEMQRPEVLREARDAALLAVAFGACRRRSEVVSLNYMQRDSDDENCKGVLILDDSKGLITVKLHVSKTNQSGTDEEYLIPRDHARLLYETARHWITVSKVQPGEPVFRQFISTGYSNKPQSGYPGVTWQEGKSGAGNWVASITKQTDKGNRKQYVGCTFKDARDAHIARCKVLGVKPQEPFAASLLMSTRLTPQSVAVIIKKRYGDMLRARMGRKKLKPDEIEALAARVAEVSGHSMRVGHITSAAELGKPTHEIQLSSGHKTPAMISLYTRVSDKVGKSSLKGMGL